MKFFLVEGIRRFIQMIVGVSLFELPGLRNIRMALYQLVFDFKGKPTFISSHVLLFRGHKNVKSDTVDVGKISIGEHLSVAADVEIDYCGNLKIGRYVWISEGCKIFTHTHKLVKDRVYYTDDSMEASELEIGDYAWLGANVLVMPSVSYIGKNSIIGSGSIVTKDIPDGVLAVGSPAKVIRELKDEELIHEE